MVSTLTDMAKANLQPIGKYVHLVDERNSDLGISNLVGLTIEKRYIPSVANIIGTDLSKYKIIRKGRFACSLMQVSRDKKMPVAMYDNDEPAIISPAYPMFEVNDEEELLPEYLNMYLMREEFDREAVFYAVGGVRGSLEWDDFMAMQMPIPDIAEQRRIVADYQAIEKRIENNNRLIQKLEETAQAIYHHSFVENIDPENLPDGWGKGVLSDIANINMGQSPDGECLNEEGDGEIFYQGRTDFGIRFPDVRIYTTSGNKRAKALDILMSVRAPVGDLNITLNDCVIGRGIAAISPKDGNRHYLYYLLLNLATEFNKVNDEGTIFGSITKTDLYNSVVIKPSKNIVKKYNSCVKLLDYYILSLHKEIICDKKIMKVLTSKM